MALAVASSSSVMVTTVVKDGLPRDVAVMPPGREPNASSTFSPSSSTVSSVAANVIVFSVSVAPKVRVSGAPE